ncbi:hypothetical protein [Actinoplanes utahensis]|uniref:Uncharacterized protein n=1 Tax=Actinoplanes utahensis TaxID=1869 RepID=A0A0A6UQC2_ACTUT|nr:hypothetical protein [Actinoplanes utahensis]KHD78310.1 hypothetical protein MB27_05575 [Actinoplanes utahensis]GIF28914.1 hypothetical protein Aut01nite_19000 [Actinoplanes utahensis]
MNDEQYGMLRLRPLVIEPGPTTRIDVAEAMRKGRRLRRTRIWSSFTGVFAVTGVAAVGGALALASPAPDPGPVLPPDPALPAACTAVRLPVGGASRASVTAGDPGGVYAVGTTNPDYEQGKRKVLVWRGGELVASLSPPGDQAVMYDINASGVAVGASDGFGAVPFVYRAGTVTRMKGKGSADAINDAGVVAGTHYRGHAMVPMRWAGPDAEPELLRLPDGVLEGRTRALAEDGTVVVELQGDKAPAPTALWLPDGTLQPLPGPGGRLFAGSFFRSGWLYGTLALPVTRSVPPVLSSPDENGMRRVERDQFDTRAHRYHVASGTWQELPGRAWSGPLEPGDGLNVFIGAGVLALPEPADKGPDDFFTVSFVSDDGRVAGGRSLSRRADPAHAADPIMWRCA